MIMLLFFLLSMNWSLQSAESAQKCSTSDTPVYVPIGVDDIAVNLEQLALERRYITDKNQRRSFILLCEAAEKVFAGHPRVHEIRELKQEELKQSN